MICPMGRDGCEIVSTTVTRNGAAGGPESNFADQSRGQPGKPEGSGRRWARAPGRYTWPWPRGAGWGAKLSAITPPGCPPRGSRGPPALSGSKSGALAAGSSVGFPLADRRRPPPTLGGPERTQWSAVWTAIGRA